MRVSFELNGEPSTLDVDPFERLSEVLRIDLGMTGTKVGCDAGDCGACTVMLDGLQVCACMVSAAQADGAEVETVEGRADDELLAELRLAFLEHGAAQCGICTPGMLMAARDILLRKPNPSRAEIEDALGGVLCRCTGYLKIVEAVESVGAQQTPQTAPTPAGCAVGARLVRIDGAPKVDGSDQFGADAAPANALWLRTIRSPHARARFELGNFDALYQRHPDLVKVLIAADIPGENSFGVYPDLKDQPVLADGEVRYRGEAILALIGPRAAIAAITAEELPIIWSLETPTVGIAAATASSVAPVHATRPDNILVHGNVECGDVDAAFDAAAAVAEGEIQTAFVEHAYIEPKRVTRCR